MLLSGVQKSNRTYSGLYDKRAVHAVKGEASAQRPRRTTRFSISNGRQAGFCPVIRAASFQGE